MRIKVLVEKLQMLSWDIAGLNYHNKYLFQYPSNHDDLMRKEPKLQIYIY